MAFFISIYTAFNVLIFRLFDIALIAHIATGVVFWTFFTSVIVESCSFTTAQASTLQNKKANILFLFTRFFLRHVAILLINVIIIIPFILYFINPFSFLVLVGFILSLLFTYFCGFILVFVGALAKDVAYILQLAIQAAFFLTPIIWHPSLTARFENHLLLIVNPIHHLLNIVRGPIIYGGLNIFSVAVLFFTIIGLSFVSLRLYNSGARGLPLKLQI